MIQADIRLQATPEQIADWLAQRLDQALAASGGAVSICVPGGSTPFPIMEDLTRRELDFSRLHIWPGDDRVVPEDHEASNTGKIRALFEPVGAHVRALSEDSTPPRFAVCWLGMGGDGHIASLFPNTDPQVDDPQTVRRLTPDPLPPHAPFDRITLTIPALLNADSVLFTLGGSADKWEVFDAALKRKHDLPIARFLHAAIAQSKRPVTCFA